MWTECAKLSVFGGLSVDNMWTEWGKGPPTWKSTLAVARAGLARWGKKPRRHAVHSSVHRMWTEIGEKTVDEKNDTPQGQACDPEASLQGSSPTPPELPHLEGNSPMTLPTGGRVGAKQVLSLAVPALGALVIEPLLLLIDSVMVGYLGTAQLAGLSLASTVLLTVVGLFVFLAYSTTAITAKALGAGKQKEGVEAGIQAIWLAVGLGVILAVGLSVGAEQIVRALGADPQVAAQATLYLRGSAFGVAGMLVVLAATGTLRGLLDMRTPLMVVSAGAVVNVTLNFLLIFGLSLGILGAGIALAITQTGMAAALVLTILIKSRDLQVSLRPAKSGLWEAFMAGSPLLIRTVSLRLALLATVAVATSAGTVALAAHQVVNSVLTLGAIIMDALPIDAQSLVGVSIGSRQTGALRTLTRTLTLWGVAAAAVIGAIVVIGAPWIPLAFGTDTEMHEVATTALRVAGTLMPIAGAVFILDGVLIGASEGKYLAYMGVVTLLGYLPALWFLHHEVVTAVGEGAPAAPWALPWLWVAFAGWFMALRALTNSIRAFSPNFGVHES